MMKRILFQGDSITDACRDKTGEQYRGSGYATLVSAMLGCDHPNEYEFINRGISGNRIIDLLARIKKDAINLAPDYMSILIGVNDVWHEINFENGIDAENFEIYYCNYIDNLKKNLPNLKLMILEPFVEDGEATHDNYETFRTEVEERAAVARKVAEKYDIPFIPLMKVFDDAQKLVPASYWLIDGVHPTAMGHALIAKEWIKTFNIIK